MIIINNVRESDYWISINEYARFRYKRVLVIKETKHSRLNWKGWTFSYGKSMASEKIKHGRIHKTYDSYHSS